LCCQSLQLVCLVIPTNGLHPLAAACNPWEGMPMHCTGIGGAISVVPPVQHAVMRLQCDTTCFQSRLVGLLWVTHITCDHHELFLLGHGGPNSLDALTQIDGIGLGPLVGMFAWWRKMHLMSVSKHTTFVVPALTKATRPCFGIVCWESVLRNCLEKLQVHESCFSVVNITLSSARLSSSNALIPSSSSSHCRSLQFCAISFPPDPTRCCSPQI